MIQQIDFRTVGYSFSPDPSPNLVYGGTPALTGELWMGGRPYSPPSRTWDMLVSLEQDPSPNLRGSVARGGLHIWHPIPDGKLDDFSTIRDIAALVADHVEAGERVLVHCSAGLNRSGVVCARALMYLGLSAKESARILRFYRDRIALFNPHFVEWLNSEDSV